MSVMIKKVTFVAYWKRIYEVVYKILRQQAVRVKEWQKCHWDASELCTWNNPDAIKLERKLLEEARIITREAHKRIEEKEDDAEFLRAYVKEWEVFKDQSHFVAMIFDKAEAILNRSDQKTGVPETGSTKANSAKDIDPDQVEYVKVKDTHSILMLMLFVWRKLSHNDFSEKLEKAWLGLLLSERNGESFDPQSIISIRKTISFMSVKFAPKITTSEINVLRFYEQHFEKVYINATKEFYLSKALEFTSNNSVIDYMKYAAGKLAEEENRGKKYMEVEHHSQSVRRLMVTCVEELVQKYKDIINAECPNLIKNYDAANLQIMFNLMDRFEGGVSEMLKYLEEHVKSDGLADMIASAATINTNPEQYGEKLMQLYERYSALVRDAFGDDPRFLASKDAGFTFVVNDTSIFKIEMPTRVDGFGSKTQVEAKSPELLAAYADMLLKKGTATKHLQSDGIEAKLRGVATVLKFITSRDVFMRYHKVNLMRRLIMETSADDEKEEMVLKFYQDNGIPRDLIVHLEQMLKDIKLKEDLNQKFKDFERARNKDHFADVANIKILNAAAWERNSSALPLLFPLELEEFLPQIEEFYRMEHPSRKICWNNNISTAIITFKTNAGIYDLEVTLMQAFVLSVWNGRMNEKISFEDLKLATDIPETDLRRTLMGLVAFPKSKLQILECNTPFKTPADFKNETQFSVNMKFSVMKGNKAHNRGRVNLIGRIQMASTKAGDENKEIVQLRIFRVQEAIVRIMKTKRVITNAALQTETCNLLKTLFPVSSRMIKEQIDWLIENQYMKRDEEDHNTFIYIT